ncbi:hypothetical protein AMATHDRAFT_7150 [Amanita thiersii Skay4041]|uniref:Pre-rRNA-processing protein TSR2 n=1 Tax=Amanita thiersii Skay4041 TaxID=703135 RepID=A0A2A9NH26_9AGAR|nr:hypothetical protein AMATHDRAFT_7150 [Amanita thiersii Skay4041]
MAGRQRPPPSLVLFARGVIARLEIWPTMRIAVQESWGGPKSADKQTWLASEIVDTFEQQVLTPDDQYIEELLLQVMEDEFDCVLEDGSAEAVARDIVKMWEQAQLGEQQMVTGFEEVAEKVRGKKIAANVVSEEDEGSDGSDDEGSEEDGEEMGVDEAPALIDHRRKNEPEIDEDGFTIVKGKGRAWR